MAGQFKSPQIDWIAARAVSAAVSVRKMRGPRRRRIYLADVARSRSLGLKPPSGPTSRLTLITGVCRVLTLALPSGSKNNACETAGRVVNH